MDHYFELPVSYNGKERNLKVRLVIFGYGYKFYIVVDGQELVFEKDNEGQYRVLTKDIKAEDKKIDIGWVQAIITTLNLLHQ